MLANINFLMPNNLTGTYSTILGSWPKYIFRFIRAYLQKLSSSGQINASINIQSSLGPKMGKLGNYSALGPRKFMKRKFKSGKKTFFPILRTTNGEKVGVCRISPVYA